MKNRFLDENLNPIEKIIIFAFVSMIVGLPQEIRKLMIANFGFGDIKLIRIYIFLVTILYIIHLNYFRRTLKAPYLIPFLVLFGAFFVTEKYLPHFGAPNFSFIVAYLQVYVFFLMLVNLSYRKVVFYKIIDYAFYSTLIFGLLYWIGFLGVIDVQYSDVEVLEILYERRSEVLTYQNFISYLCAFSILLIIIRRLRTGNFDAKETLADVLYFCLFSGLIVLQGTRGAAISAVVLMAYYTTIFLTYRYASKTRRKNVLSVLLIVILLFLASSAIFLFGSNLSTTHFYYRFQTLAGVELRLENMANAFENFLDHPFIGVGYDHAAIRGAFGTRSNNEYMQILAGSGIFVFVIYIYCLFRLFVFRLEMLKKPEIALCAFYFAFLILFERPFDMVAIIAYMTFYFSHEKTTIQKFIAPFEETKVKDASLVNISPLRKTKGV